LWWLAVGVVAVDSKMFSMQVPVEVVDFVLPRISMLLLLHHIQ
jgi:hypothetical protein